MQPFSHMMLMNFKKHLFKSGPLILIFTAVVVGLQWSKKSAERVTQNSVPRSVIEESNDSKAIDMGNGDLGENKNIEILVESIVNLPAKTYDEKKILEKIDHFNAGDLHKHGVVLPEDEDVGAIDLPEGVKQVSFEDHGGYFSLLVTEVMATHTAKHGVDAGSDRFFTIFFRKTPLKRIAAIPSKSFAFGDPTLRVGIGDGEGCFGLSPGKDVSVVDLRQGLVHFVGTFQDEPYGYDLSAVSKSPNSLSITTWSESDFTGPPRTAKQCEASHWVDKKETKYLVTCDRIRSKCEIRGTKTRRYAGCADIGSCD